MPTTLPLPDGQHALMRDPEQISQRQRRPFERLRAKVSVVVDTDNDLDQLAESERTRVVLTRLVNADEYDLADQMNDAMIMMFVQDWSFGDVTPDALVDLPGHAYDALLMWCQPMLDKVFLRTGYDKADENRTGPIGASNG